MRKDFLMIKSADEMIESDMKELSESVKRLAKDAVKLGAVNFGLGTTIVKGVACLAALYLLVLDRTNWRTNILTSLLVPYVYLSLPSFLFDVFTGDVGQWLAFIGVAMKLFFDRHFPVTLELIVSLILLIAVAPNFIAETMRTGLIGVFINLAIAIYLFVEHIRSSGGIKNAFTNSSGISNTIGIVTLLLYPVWGLVVYFL